MSYCRECGKGVEDAWVTCPFCSKKIGPPAVNPTKVSDSVIIGDINTTVNDSSTISTALKQASKCMNCDSVSTTQTACSVCRNIAYCTVCYNDVKEQARPIVERIIGQEIWMDFDKWYTSLPRLCKTCFTNKMTTHKR
jgi:hypothetical protein